MSPAATRVEQLCDLGRLDDAERAARAALAGEPQDVAVLLALARVLLKARKHAAGLEAAEAAVALAPQDERPHRLRGLLLSGLGRHAEALEAGFTSVSLEPDEFYAALGYAVLLQRAGRLADAQEVALRAVALDPDDPSGHLRLADIASERGDRTTARRAYAETLRLDPDNAAARNDLAVLDLGARRPTAALRGFVEAGQLDPTLPEVLRNVRVVLWRLAGRLRGVLLVGTLGLLVAGGPADAVDHVGLRIGAAVVLALVVGVVVWTTRGVPAQSGPAVRAALRGDRLLAFTSAVLAACVVVLAVVAVTGFLRPALLMWQALLLLTVLAAVRGWVSRFRGRRG